LTDVLSHAFEINKRAPQKPLKDNRKSSQSSQKAGSELLFEVNNRLLRLYNEKPLMETFMDILHKYLKPSFVFVFMPHADKSHLTIRYGSGTIPDQIQKFRMNRQEALVSLLSRQHGVHRLNHIEEALGLDPLVEMLKETGVKLMTAMSLPGRRQALLGIGEKKVRPGLYNPDDVNILNALSQTLRMTLHNIYQFRKIEELSYTDHMTGMYNYRYFYKRLAEEIMRAKRFNHELALVIFDIDGFKEFNDTYGHQAGDSILKQLGHLVEDSVRSIDILSRYGGDEFCLVMPESGLVACEQFMERLRRQIENHTFRNRYNNKQLTIKISMGGALYPMHAERADRLIYCADMALMDAKQSGRNRISVYDAELDKKTVD
jgi:diguanylate cyclase (GGDEF)-like protein